jgi:ABC-2 type transport system permease protein
VSGVATVYRWELRKLRAQKRTYLGLGIAIAMPILFVVALSLQNGVPEDVPFGRFVRESGLAIPLVLLVFGSVWLFPLITSLVAGDIFASEDQHGTWKTILTRSHGRTQIFWGKSFAAATFAVLILVALTISSLTAGVLLVGHQPLESLTGTLIPSGHAAWLVLAAWSTSLPPLLGFTSLAIMLSVLTRNSPAGIVGPVVVGLIMQLYAFLNGADLIRHLLLTTPFDSWHGLLVGQPFYGPLIRGAILSVVYIAVCLGVAFTALRRRDITGG